VMVIDESSPSPAHPPPPNSHPPAAVHTIPTLGHSWGIAAECETLRAPASVLRGKRRLLLRGKRRLCCYAAGYNVTLQVVVTRQVSDNITHGKYFF
jgi:hypothetical protein